MSDDPTLTVDDLRKKTVLTIPEAGRVLGLMSRSACYRAAAQGDIPGVIQVGGKKVVSAPVILDVLLQGRELRDAS